MTNSIKIRPVGTEFFHADGRTGMAKLKVAFRVFANAPKFIKFASSTLWSRIIGSGGIIPLNLNLDTKNLYIVRARTIKFCLPTTWNAAVEALIHSFLHSATSRPVGWASDLVRTIWSTDKSLAAAGNRTQVYQSVAMCYTDCDTPASVQVRRYMILGHGSAMGLKPWDTDKDFLQHASSACH